jgi:hypothetical protein
VCELFCHGLDDARATVTKDGLRVVLETDISTGGRKENGNGVPRSSPVQTPFTPRSAPVRFKQETVEPLFMGSFFGRVLYVIIGGFPTTALQTVWLVILYTSMTMDLKLITCACRAIRHILRAFSGIHQ